MKRLNYKSIDSLLKNENIFEIYGALRFAETPEWLNEFNTYYETLKPSDFEERDIVVVPMPAERWGSISESFVHKKRHNITHVKEMGIILMLPVPYEKMSGICITVLPLLFHYLNEIRLYSTFFKMQQVKPDFAKIFINTLIADPASAAVMSGQNIHWRVIQRYFGKLENEYHPEIFEPHVQPEDLHWRRAEELLFMIEPKLSWWRDLDYVGVMHSGRPDDKYNYQTFPDYLLKITPRQQVDFSVSLNELTTTEDGVLLGDVPYNTGPTIGCPVLFEPNQTQELWRWAAMIADTAELI